MHLPAADAQGKFDMLVLMMQKLYALVSGQCAPDNPDSPMHQELLLPGVLYGALLKEQLDEYLLAAKKLVQRDVRLGKADVSFADATYFRKVLAQCADPCKKLDYLLATGNLNSPTGLDQMQVSGFTIVADKLNFFRCPRALVFFFSLVFFFFALTPPVVCSYLSHFRCVHRGAFFAQMKTTAVRKLLPEAWGFVCPVHTPDGAPCGLLNHLARACVAVNEVSDTTVRPLPWAPRAPAPPPPFINRVCLAGFAVGADGPGYGAAVAERGARLPARRAGRQGPRPRA